jgi:hypothetical protein
MIFLSVLLTQSMQNSNKINTEKLMPVISLLGVFLITTGLSWSMFTFLRKEPGTTPTPKPGTKLDTADLPKTEECPLNGAMFTVPEREVWETRRPLTVMIENHLDARPLSGISKADIVYEAVAEGGITRFLGVFYCGASKEDFDIAVVRSARVYYISWASEYGDKPLFMHWGGANNIDNNSPSGVKYSGAIDPRVDAFKLLTKLGWRNGTYGNDLDGQSNFGYPALVRIQDRRGLGRQDPAEHTPNAHVASVFEQAGKRGFGFKDKDGNSWNGKYISWKFSDDKPTTSDKVEEISFSFWRGKTDYDVSWKYDSNTNSYLRFNGGNKATDFYFDNVQVSAKNVVVQFVREEGPVDKEGHMFYTTVGTGDALIFQNGQAIEGEWKKLANDTRTKFYDQSGKEITFVRGTIWVEAVPFGNKITY